MKRARERAGRTQAGAAKVLEVSQTYLSLLEAGKRELPDDLRRKAARLFCADPKDVSLRSNFWNVREATNAELAAQLSALKYPGLAHVKSTPPENPVEVLLGALKARDLERRLVEALPWVLCEYPDLDWRALFMGAKVNDIQNRLGFILNLAWRVAQNRDMSTSAKLRIKEAEIEESRLWREDTLCQMSMPQSQKDQLKTNRPKEAEHWRLYTDLTPSGLNY